ncbi:MAG: iron-sulfur cluster-binding protein [Proteobacteria bacterium]|nr:iron-sulfur cluster-binding protein [Pseudomonadota bacterium]
MTKISFKEDVKQAIANDQLRTIFDRFSTGMMAKRKAAFPDRRATENCRNEANRIKRRIIAKLPELLEKLEAKCTENGIQVHWAETAEAGNEIVHGILKEKKVSKVVKGKSMMTEEMYLNDYLENEGITCIETDLGEYIIQMAGEAPSHIIAPAAHKNVQQISKLFHEGIPNTEYTEDVEKLTLIARNALRDEFYQADAGITGVNFAVAETGTICLVENEGNGRYCSTLPPIHIAVMGLEKVVEKLEDVPPLLNLLTRSAAGQAISTYFNMINSPRKNGEQDGPDEVHLVIVDNGRSNIHQDDELSQVMTCIRCGACMNHCPVYVRIGGHAYGSVIPGPIGEILMPQLNGLDAQGHLSTASTLCGACSEVCPVKIPIPKLLLRLRQEGVNKDMQSEIKGTGSQKTWSESMLWKSWRMANAHPAFWKMQRSLMGKMGEHLPEELPVMKNWTMNRTAPKLAGKSLHDLAKEEGIDNE